MWLRQLFPRPRPGRSLFLLCLLAPFPTEPTTPPLRPTDGPPRVPPSWGQGPAATRWAQSWGLEQACAGPALQGVGSLPRNLSLGSTQGAPGQESRVSGPFGFHSPATAPQAQPSPAKCTRMPAMLPAGMSGPTEHAGARWAAGACDSRRRCLHRPPFLAVSRNQRGKGLEPVLGPLVAISHNQFPQEESAQPSAGGGGGGLKSVL